MKTKFKTIWVNDERVGLSTFDGNEKETLAELANCSAIQSESEMFEVEAFLAGENNTFKHMDGDNILWMIVRM